MSLKIFEHGDGRYRLFRDDLEVGWVLGRDIGFGGFADEESAIRAATAAYDALSGWLSRQRRDEAAPRRGRRLGARHDGGERVLTLGGVPIGRLVHSHVDLRPDDGSHGFELRLPPRFGAALTAAQVIDNALVRHRALSALEAGAREALAGA